MKLTLAIAAALTGTLIYSTASGGAHSQIAQRQAAMKSIGAQMKILGGMARIGGSFDDFFAIAAFETMQEDATNAARLFPLAPNTDETTRATAAIWAETSDFDEKMRTFIADINAAVRAEPTNQSQFVPLFAVISENCRSCHQLYRTPKP